jgi:leader peptidase (prepilin peptidase) / N-methyltransferase
MTASPEQAKPVTDAAAANPAPRTALSRAAPSLFGALYALLAIPALLATDIPAAALMISILLAAALVALSVIDMETMRLPDAITLPLIAAGPLIAWALGWDTPFWRILSAGAGFMALFGVAEAYRALRGRSGLGLGDAKLFAAAGAWLGMGALPSVLLWACGIAIAAVLLAVALRRNIRASSRIPFGPFLAFGFWMVWLHGPL